MPKLTKMEWFVAVLSVLVLLLGFVWFITVSPRVKAAAPEPVELAGELTLSGSTALLPLLDAAVTEFQALHPDVRITLEGGGSGKGRTDVCAGAVDIGNSDIPLSEQEKTDLNCQNAAETLIAMQAFVFAANPQGPGDVTDLTLEQLQAIFSGEISNWQDVGGKDLPIIVVNREEGSGTRSNITDYLYGGDESKVAAGGSELPSNGAIYQALVETPGAISYLGFAYASQEGIVVFSTGGIEPTPEIVQAGDWPITGPGLSITKDQPADLAAHFLNYVTSDAFQELPVVTQLGFVPIADELRSSQSTDGSATATVPSTLTGRLTIAGSSAMLPLVQEASLQFQQMHPGVSIAVSAGGSGAGRSQVCNGDIDIGDSDVPLSAEEKAELNCQSAVETLIASQAFVVAANATGPGSVTNLSKTQLQDIFSGRITNWSEVGGDNQQIVLINRTQGSGTRAVMADYLYDGDDSQFATGASEESNNETAYQTTAQTPGAITYLGLAYGEQSGIVVFSIDEILPPLDETSQAAAEWPITGPALSITKDGPAGVAKEFLDFTTSDQFQDQPVFQQLGFLSIPEEMRSVSDSASEPAPAPGEPLSGRLTIAGSSAMLPLVQEASLQFQQMNPDVSIAVSAGGSGAGRSQVCNGDIDIGNSDVPLSEEEKQELNCQNAVETLIAYQAFVVAANPTGPAEVTNLTKEQLRDIFSGKITNWSEVGGDDQQIVLINRTQGSGTRAVMADYLYDGDDSQFATGASEESNNETAYQTMSQTPGAITYLGLAYGSQSGIVVFSVDGVAATTENVQAGTWQITGPALSITKEAPADLSKAFLDFMTSNEFQDDPIVEELGFVAIPVNMRSDSSTTGTTPEPEPAPQEPLSGRLTIAGSSAMLPLVQEASIQFQQMNSDVSIAVSAGGSGAGRSQVCNGDIDIGNSDVPLTASEREELNCQNAVETLVAYQGFVVVANPEGPGSVTDLSKAQLQDIFSGKITNWSEVGGDDQQIVLINRSQGSGTRAVMADYLYDGDDSQFATGASEESNNETAYQTTVQTPGTITYLGLAYGEQSGIVVFSVDGIEPTAENVQSGAWQITGPGLSITKEAPAGLSKAFLDFMTSDQFQDDPVFEQLGFVPIDEELRSD